MLLLASLAISSIFLTVTFMTIGEKLPSSGIPCPECENNGVESIEALPKGNERWKQYGQGGCYPTNENSRTVSRNSR